MLRRGGRHLRPGCRPIVSTPFIDRHRRPFSASEQDVRNVQGMERRGRAEGGCGRGCGQGCGQGSGCGGFEAGRCRRWYRGQPGEINRLLNKCQHGGLSDGPKGYRLGSYRIATTPEPNSNRPTSLKSIRFERPANRVGPWPAIRGWTTNSYSSIKPGLVTALSAKAKALAYLV